jgi:hypothetical protein
VVLPQPVHHLRLVATQTSMDIKRRGDPSFFLSCIADFICFDGALGFTWAVAG